MRIPSTRAQVEVSAFHRRWGHLLGGVSGYDAAETTDEDPERVALVQRLTWVLRTTLYPVRPPGQMPVLPFVLSKS